MTSKAIHQGYWRKASKDDAKHSLVVPAGAAPGSKWTATASSQVVSTGKLLAIVKSGSMTLPGSDTAQPVDFWTVERDSKTAAQREQDAKLRDASKAAYLAAKAAKAAAPAPAPAKAAKAAPAQPAQPDHAAALAALLANPAQLAALLATMTAAPAPAPAAPAPASPAGDCACCPAPATTVHAIAEGADGQPLPVCRDHASKSSKVVASLAGKRQQVTA